MRHPFIKSSPRPLAAPPLPAVSPDVADFMTAAAPPASLLASLTKATPPPAVSRTPIFETGGNLAELRIRHWLLQQEKEAKDQLDRRLYPQRPRGR